MRNPAILSFCLLSGVGLVSCSSSLKLTERAVHTNNDMQTVLELSPEVRSVSSGGLWSHGGKEGWLRFVVIGGGVEHYQTSLYLQWFWQPADSDEIELLSTSPVVEFDRAAASPAPIRHHSFAAPKCVDKTACTRATLQAFDKRFGLTKEFLLLLDEGPGRYRLVPPDVNDV